MVLIQLNGGLGNQLFQYAFGRRIALDRKAELRFDLSAFTSQNRQYKLHYFNVIGSPASASELKQFFWWKQNTIFSLFYRLWSACKAYYRRRWVEEQSIGFDKNMLMCPREVYLRGYWQSEKYFKEIESILREELTVQHPLNGSNLSMMERIKSCTAVSLHVRRGDYVWDPPTNSTHGILPLEYYQAAIGLILEHVPTPTFFVFSDDIAWVKENLRIERAEVVFVDHNSTEMDYEDLRLMSHCQHHILANSSFSWWGAWLSSKEDKLVIAPRKWYAIDLDTRDLVPEGWIQL